MFRVRWLQTAIDDMDALWANANPEQRGRIVEAVRQIDQALQSDPVAGSESREADVRILFAPPLGVTFRIEDLEDVVSVLHVWTFRTPR